MNSKLENALFKLYDNEINISNFSSYNTLLKTLILYKDFASIDSYVYEGKLDMIVAEKETALPESIKNSVVVGGEPFMPEEKIDKLISAFINKNIQEESDRYVIYLDHDNRVIHIAKSDHSYGYNVFNSSIEKVFCAIITKAMPWYFAELPSKVMQEYAPLFVDNSDFYLFNEKFEEYVDKSGLKETILKDQMAKMAVKIVEKKKRQSQEQLENNQRSMDDHLRKAFELNAKVKELRANIIAMEMQGDEYESPIKELIDFIETTPENIKIEEVYDENIKFSIITEPEYFDDYEGCIRDNSGNSYLFGGVYIDDPNPFKKYTTEQIKYFYKKLIEDREIKVQMSMIIDLNIVTGYPRAERYEVPNSIEHPHLNVHNCFGTATEAIASFAIANRYSEALNQIIYCAKQLTLPDSAPGKYFTRGIVEKQCIKCPDGVFRNFDETMQYLEENKEA